MPASRDERFVVIGSIIFDPYSFIPNRLRNNDEKEKITDNGLEALFFFEDLGVRRKAVIMLGGHEGGIPSWAGDEERIQELVRYGFVVLSLAYYRTAHLPMSLERIPLEYFESAFAWLAGQSGVIPDDYAIVGESKGGELALLLGSRYPQIQAIAAIVPSFVVFQGIPNGIPRSLKPKSSWSYKGLDVPFVPFDLSITLLRNALTHKFLNTHQKALRNSQRVSQAAIPVENIRGPVWLASGRQDEQWPSTSMCEEVMRRLDEHHFEHHHEHTSYDYGHKVIRVDACWRAIVDFLKKNFDTRVETESRSRE